MWHDQAQDYQFGCVFIQCKYTGTNLRNKIMGKCLSKKYLKFPSKKSKNKVLLGNIKS